MKLDHTSVVFINNDDSKVKTRPKAILAKDCSLCNDQWIYSGYHPILGFIKKLFHPSSRYCQCQNNRVDMS